MRFGFLEGKKVDHAVLSQYDDRAALIEGFLMERSINIMWGASGLGKTWFCFALANILNRQNCDVVYMDMDNSLDTIKERGIDQLIQSHDGRLHYVIGDLMDDPKREIIEIFEKIEGNAVNGYEKAVFVFDSLQFFLGGGLYDEAKIERIVMFCKRIRRHGGTVLIINHSTKKGDAMKGGGSLINSVDEVWEIEKAVDTDGMLSFIFNPEKKRMNVDTVAYGVDTKQLSLHPLSVSDLRATPEEREFVKRVKEQLTHGPLSQGPLLELLERPRTDKNGRAWLEKYQGKQWSVQKKGREKVYSIIEKK